jgi:subtilisin family serine protease
VLLRFSDALDLQPLSTGPRNTRDNRVMRALQAHSALNVAALQPLLQTLGAAQVRALWLINGLALTLPAHHVPQLAADPAVARLDLDSFVQGGRSQRTPVSRNSGVAPAASVDGAEAGQVALAAPPAPATPSPVEPPWNLEALQVPALWALGYRGRGITVASLDTGADLAHPDLHRQWRGGRNSWFDPHAQEANPYDALGHGTQTLGVMLGAGGTGVAPQAQWIAARLYNGEGRASMSDIHRAFQWLMDPDGDASTLDAPDVVNASWSLSGRSSGRCVMEFADDIRALKAAGIAVVFAAGNDGPQPGTSNSPGNNPGVLSVGAAGRDLEISRSTSRGPSACDAKPYPGVLAPGVGIFTTDLSHGGLASYTTLSGSSLAAPHTSGVLALLAEAFPGASVAELESALLRSTYHHGIIDAQAAFQILSEAVQGQQKRVPKP